MGGWKEQQPFQGWGPLPGNNTAWWWGRGTLGATICRGRQTPLPLSWHSPISCAQLAPRPRPAGVGSPSRDELQDWLLKLYSLQNLYQRHDSLLGLVGSLELQRDSDVSFPFPTQDKPDLLLLPSKGTQDGGPGQTTEGSLGL